MGCSSLQPVSESGWVFTFPKALTSISANGNQDGIVWAIEPSQYTNNGDDILYAFDGTNLATQLYATTQDPERDNPPPAAKFQIPVVANGKVYIRHRDPGATSTALYRNTSAP